jgi:hypothetical protein
MNKSEVWHGNRVRSIPEAYQQKKNRAKAIYRETQMKLDKCWANRYAAKKMIAKYGQFKEVPIDEIVELGFNPKFYESEATIRGQIFFSLNKGYFFSFSHNKNIILCKQ